MLHTRTPHEWKVRETLPMLIEIGGQEREFEVEVEIRQYAGCPDFYDRTLGGWLPGDAPETELLSAKIKGQDMPVWLWEAMAEMDWPEMVDLSPPEPPER